MCKASAANSFLSVWVIASMSKRIVSQDLGYNENFNELVVTHSETKVPICPASTAYVNNSKSFRQGLSTRICRPLAITDLADASYFFALGAKVQARKPGRPGPFDLVDPRAQRGRRGPIQVPRCVKSIRLFFLGRPNYFFCRRFHFFCRRFLLKVGTSGKKPNLLNPNGRE